MEDDRHFQAGILFTLDTISIYYYSRYPLEKKTPVIEIDESKLVPRPPVLCAGCPHRGIFYLLGRRKDLFIAGDIGCYGLGAMAPLSAMDTCLCMGASISGGHGAARAREIYDLPMRVVSVIGDSTFFHSGMTGLLNVVYNHSPVVTVILDNRVTGMTGHQEHPGTGLTAQGDPAAEADIPAIVKALGIKELSVVNPLKLDETRAALDRALNLDEPSVIICRWPCALKKMSAADRSEFPPAPGKYYVDADACVGCGKCAATGCPALSLKVVTEPKPRPGQAAEASPQPSRSKAPLGQKSAIDSAMCLGCSICAQVCPKEAIRLEGETQ